MLPRQRRLALALSAAALLALPAAASAAGTLQPGAIVSTDAGRCTLNFVFTDASSTYLGTAAHCVTGVNTAARDKDGEVFGDVALVGNADLTAEDYALIRVRPGALGRVSPRVKGSPRYPTGVTTPADTRTGDTIQLSGFGQVFELFRLTQERRVGLMVNDDANRHTVVAPLIFGDSGGPLVHTRTGRAMGIVSRLCVGLCTEEGPTVQGILAKARARGFALALRTG
jgi:hypothetical protein